jgi:nucleoside-triphosphatase
MPEQIIILTGDIRSGKTGKLISWCQGRSDVCGLLTPVIEGSRFFWNICSQEQFQMEASYEEDAFVVGRYRFSRKSFERAIAVIQNSIDNDGWLVLDEIGPLELRDEGFSGVIKELLNQRKGKTLFVVRKALVEDVISHFQLNRFKIKLVDVNDPLPS